MLIQRDTYLHSFGFAQVARYCFDNVCSVKLFIAKHLNCFSLVIAHLVSLKVIAIFFILLFEKSQIL